MKVIGTFYLQSSYSMLKNLIPMEKLIEEAINNGYEFVALSDEFLHGINEFYRLVDNTKMKPIVGIKLSVLEPEETDFLVYIKNRKGYQNLLELVKLKALNHHF